MLSALTHRRKTSSGPFGLCFFIAVPNSVRSQLAGAYVAILGAPLMTCRIIDMASLASNEGSSRVHRDRACRRCLLVRGGHGSVTLATDPQDAHRALQP